MVQTFAFMHVLCCWILAFTGATGAERPIRRFMRTFYAATGRHAPPPKSKPILRKPRQCCAVAFIEPITLRVLLLLLLGCWDERTNAQAQYQGRHEYRVSPGIFGS
uniref:Secreted protein n=1 Tax=Anopheles coluzzii TaxID=1518534 RepID=A0A8W7PF96_ANOCL